MATEFTVLLEDRPGALADLTEVMAQNAVSIVAIHATPCPSHGVTQFVTNHPDAAIEALKDAQISYTVRDVLLLALNDDPGSLARLTRALGSAGININALYLTMNGQIVLDASDLTKAQQIALSLQVGRV